MEEPDPCACRAPVTGLYKRFSNWLPALVYVPPNLPELLQMYEDSQTVGPPVHQDMLAGLDHASWQTR